MPVNPFYVGTCENKANIQRHIVFEPVPQEPLKPFLIEDPFGLRKAVVPVLKRNSANSNLKCTP
jgi:serine protease Do